MLFHYDDMILWCRSLEFQLSLESNQWNEWMKKNHKLNRHGISMKINSSFFLYSTFSMHFFMFSKRKHVKYSHWQLSTIWKFIASIYKLQCQIEFIILVKWKSKWKAIQRQASEVIALNMAKAKTYSLNWISILNVSVSFEGKSKC